MYTIIIKKIKKIINSINNDNGKLCIYYEEIETTTIIMLCNSI